MAKPVIAIPLGDPAGIGPEIALKAAVTTPVRTVCRPLLVGDPAVVRFYADRQGFDIAVSAVDQPSAARFAEDSVDVLAVPGFDVATLAPGTVEAEYGRAAHDAAAVAIDLALDGEVAAVAAGPHTQSAIAAAGIAFDGYPGFVARRAGVDPDEVFLMLSAGGRRIVHLTLHLGLREALSRIDRRQVLRAVVAAHAALARLGIETPKIAVASVNPHAGEGGLLGHEEIDIIAPAIADARTQGIDADGPFGADTMFVMDGYDAFVVMYHDQGHIPAKLAGRDGAAFTIGTPIMFATVAHGSAHDIAGKGVADPSALIGTILALAAIGEA